MAIRVYIPEAFIQLHLEVQHHPLLFQRMQKHPSGETAMVLAEIAAYCGIAVSGTFDEDELAQLAELCLEHLKKVSAPRAAIYLPPDDWESTYERVAREMEAKKRKPH